MPPQFLRLKESPVRLLYGIAAILLGLHVFFVLVSVYEIALYPFEVDYGEAFSLYFAKAVNEGAGLYNDISSYPAIPVPYPPVYMGINAVLLELTGISLAPGRLVSSVSAIMIAGLIFEIVRHQTGSRWVACMVGLFFLASPHVAYWMRLARVDTLGLFFSFAGMVLILKGNGRKFAFPAMVLFLLSLYTKQSFVAAPGAALIYLFFETGVSHWKVFVFSGRPE